MTENQKNTHLEWTDNLIKGRIAEVIFEQMMLSSDRFTVIPFGYEKKTPEIASRSRHLTQSDAVEVLKRSPDFVLIDNETHNVLLIEVKFQTIKSNHWTLEAAEAVLQTWKPAYIFLATANGFYFDSVKNIVANRGEIPVFGHNLISLEMQTEYLQIIKRHLA